MGRLIHPSRVIHRAGEFGRRHGHPHTVPRQVEPREPGWHRASATGHIAIRPRRPRSPAVLIRDATEACRDGHSITGHEPKHADAMRPSAGSFASSVRRTSATPTTAVPVPRHSATHGVVDFGSRSFLTLVTSMRPSRLHRGGTTCAGCLRVPAQRYSASARNYPEANGATHRRSWWKSTHRGPTRA